MTQGLEALTSSFKNRPIQRGEYIDSAESSATSEGAI